MELISVGPIYLGLDKESFWDFWQEGSTVSVHLGTVRLEWDCRVRHHGPTQEPSHGSNHGTITCCYGGTD